MSECESVRIRTRGKAYRWMGRMMYGDCMEKGKLTEVRTFLPPTVIEKIDMCVQAGDLGRSRSAVVRQVLLDWARGLMA